MLLTEGEGHAVGVGWWVCATFRNGAGLRWDVFVGTMMTSIKR